MLPVPSRRTSRVGTLDWARETHGVLRARDRWVFLGQACLYGLAVLPWEIRRSLGIKRRRLERIDPAVLEPPDSRASREAEQLIADTTSPTVASHSRRTYAWAAAVAAHDRLAYDKEVVYVASLLHDLYFESPRALPFAHCFTLPAAERTIALGDAAGWDEQRRIAAAAAITLHANLWPPRDNTEAHLVFVGARLDITGYRYWDLHPETIGAVLERHPRFDLKRQFAPMFKAQAATNRGSRVPFMTRYLGGEWFVRRAPFDA